MATPPARTFPLAAAALLAAGLVAAAGVPPLSGLGLIGFLALVAEEDVRRRRISNRVTFPAFAGAVCHATWTAGTGGLLFALTGALVGLAVLAVPFVLRGVGAGDVKAMMVVGACIGPVLTLELLFWITLAAGSMAVAILAARGTAKDALPYGAAMGLGVAACELWGSGCLS